MSNEILYVLAVLLIIVDIFLVYVCKKLNNDICTCLKFIKNNIQYIDQIIDILDISTRSSSELTNLVRKHIDEHNCRLSFGSIKNEEKEKENE